MVLDSSNSSNLEQLALKGLKDTRQKKSRWFGGVSHIEQMNLYTTTWEKVDDGWEGKVWDITDFVRPITHSRQRCHGYGHVTALPTNHLIRRRRLPGNSVLTRRSQSELQWSSFPCHVCFQHTTPDYDVALSPTTYRHTFNPATAEPDNAVHFAIPV